MGNPIRDFALDANGDMATDGGDRSTVAGMAAVVQAVQIKVAIFLGEIFLDQTIGVDYFGQVLIKNPDPLIVQALIRERIASVPDVTSVVGSDLKINADRTATIKYQIRTAYSTSPITGEVTLP